MNDRHHAVLVRSDSIEGFSLNEKTEDCEITDTTYEKLGISEVRELINQAHQRPMEGDCKLMIIRTEFITIEAQNALLKVLEEPPQSTSFIFVVPESFQFLPTLLSRFSQGVEGDKVTDENINFDEFLKSDIKKRLEDIETHIKKKDVAWQRSIKVGLIEYIKSQQSDKNKTAELEFTARLLLTRGASNKMLLEQTALTLPTR